MSVHDKEVLFEGKSIGSVLVTPDSYGYVGPFDIETDPAWPGGMPYAGYDSVEDAEKQMIESFLEYREDAKGIVEELNKWIN